MKWRRLDSLVKVWIYDTISTSLLQTVLKKNATAKDVWKSLEDLFHDNKEARAMELHEELRSMKLRDLSIVEYFKRIKVIADLLANINLAVDENNLVMHAMNGLGDKYVYVKQSDNGTMSGGTRNSHGTGNTRGRLGIHNTPQRVTYVGPVHHQPSCGHAFAPTGAGILGPAPQPQNITSTTAYGLIGLILGASSDGSLSRYKARLVTNGKSQQSGIDCDETFSLVVKPATIRTVLSLVVSRQSPIHQLDVKNAFLYGYLTKTVYMHQPSRGTDIAYLLLYVDDIILTVSSSAFLQRIISSLHGDFAMTDLGLLNYFFGISATRITSGIFLSQSKYATEILERAHMLNYNPCRTPIDTEKKLGPDGSLVSDPNLYRSIARALQYLTFTWHDLSYAVQQLCIYIHDPREPHFNAMKRVFRYLRSTTDLGLQLFRSTTSQLTAYSDADLAGCPATHLSTSGYCVFLGDNLLTWSSKRQDTLSQSST
ncbi:ribonuclease H-like domain-containing protein [Tanacetum coccineum]